ncbi:MAG: hypothetical protein QM765_02860 [Myxococcales bacterium]
MKRLPILVALALASCGQPPAPPTPKPDAGVVDRCQDEICLPGEECNPAVGCFCTTDSCPTPSICGEESRCVNLCASAGCVTGERCVPTTGKCECGSGTDPCASDKYCEPSTKRCSTKCTGAGCGRGERCNPATGGCECADCAAETLGCDPTSNRCVDRCPSACPAGERCDDPVVGECHCTETSCAASQICDGNRRCVDLCQGKSCNPGERCDAKTGGCVCDACGSRDQCDPVTNRCVPKCQGVTCPAGEVCQDTSGECHCGIAPNTCPAGQKCDPASLKCVDLCQGVSCGAGESCNSSSGVCECAQGPDTCTAHDPTSRCDVLTKKCVAQCLGVSCAPGEGCDSSSGTCKCIPGTSDSCSAAAPTLRCNALSLHCEEKCKGVGCATGEACVATSGECHCGIPNTCPAGQKCDAASLQCVGLCSGVTCTVRGEVCEAATGACACTAAPDSCTALDASTKCDAASRKCVSQCAGLSCAPGESCNLGSGACECLLSPDDTCTASVATNRCNATTLHCQPKCQGVTCSTGESCVASSGACACGLSPNTCPAGQKCDAATLHCVGLCSGVTCTVGGESCSAATGVCSCSTSPDGCDLADRTMRCDGAILRCVPKCQGIFCAAGESCGATSGACACTASPDSCSAIDATARCNASRHCEPKCTGITCATGMACVATTGECHCSLPNSCPSGQKCLAAGLICVPACQGVTCSTPGESCEAATGSCTCQTSPADSCTVASASTRCDASSHKCVSACAGVSCAPGETCDSSSGTATCKCSRSPADSCTAASATQKCDAASLRCVLLCSGVSCTSGETCNPASGACECGPETCPANYACSATTRHCESCLQETDAQFCARQSKECDGLTGTDNCGRSRTANCGSCTSPAACTGGLCLKPGGPTNDNCVGAIPLVFDGSGKASASGDTTNASDGGRAAVCGVGFGNDVVYSFTTAATKNVDVRLTYTGSQTPVVYVRKVCASAASADELACADSISTQTAIAAINNLAAGTYYVFADAYSGDSGAFTLVVQLANPPVAPANDTCSAATVLDVSSGSATVAGDTRSAVNDYAGTCASPNNTDGGDAVFALDLAVARSVTATVTRDGTTPAYKPAVYLRTACTSGASTDEAGCGTESSGVASAVAATVGPGRVYVVVDGTAGTGGKYILQVTTAAPLVVPTNEKCSSAAALTLSAAGTASVSSTTTYAANDTAGTCAGTGPELVWTFTTPKLATITAKVTPTSGAGFQPVVYLRTGACEGTGMTEPVCASAYNGGDPATATIANAAAATYWVFVDGFAGTKGNFMLDVTLVPPNDQCSGVVALTKGTTVNGNSNYAAYHYGAADKASFSTACQVASNYGTKGPDVVYSYTPTTAGSFTVTATPAAGYDLALWGMESWCGNYPGSCLAFNDAAYGGAAESLTIAGVAGRTYYFVVGSYFASTNTSGSGAFTIAVQ